MPFYRKVVTSFCAVLSSGLSEAHLNVCRGRHHPKSSRAWRNAERVCLIYLKCVHRCSNNCKKPPQKLRKGRLGRLLMWKESRTGEERDQQTDAGTAVPRGSYHPSHIIAPPPPCLPVAHLVQFLLIFTHYLTTQRGSEPSLYFHSCLPSDHGIKSGLRGFCSHLENDCEGFWKRLLSSPRWTTAVCWSPTLCLLLTVSSLAAEVGNHERGSPPARVWLSASVQETAPPVWLLLCQRYRYVLWRFVLFGAKYPQSNWWLTFKVSAKQHFKFVFYLYIYILLGVVVACAYLWCSG